MHPSERPLERLVRRKKSFGFIYVYQFPFFCLGADTRRDERSPALSVRRGQHFCFVPAERRNQPERSDRLD
jgi:hypothetical protein